MIRISIIVPVFNVEKYISRTIESVLHQTFSDWELLLVDDCGSDKSMSICREYAVLDDRIKLIYQSVNVGPMKARQTGIESSKGIYLFFLDSDDILPPDALQILFNAAESTGAEIVRGQIDTIDQFGVIKPFGRDFLPYENNTVGILRALLEGKMRHNLASALFHKRLFLDYKYIIQNNMRNGEDGLMFYQLVQNLSSSLVILPDTVYLYFQNANSSSHIRMSKQSLVGLAFFYNYVSNLPYPDLKTLAMRYCTKNMNEFAITQGYYRFKAIQKDISSHPFLSINYRIKYLTFKQHLRWIIKIVLSILNKK